jgi:hypothetical protein
MNYLITVRYRDYSKKKFNNGSRTIIEWGLLKFIKTVIKLCGIVLIFSSSFMLKIVTESVGIMVIKKNRY